MIRAMSSALSGLRNHQLMLDVVGNDIANVSTIGFKGSTTIFSDVLTQTLRGAGQPTATAGGTNPAQVGLGSRLAGTVQSFTQGALQRTGRSSDLAIQGDGFFRIQLYDGSYGYTRDGSFKIDSEGRLVTASGYQVQPSITVPNGVTSVTISPDGLIQAKVTGQVDPVTLGTLQVADFINPAGLQPRGQNLLVETVASGTPQVGNPNIEGRGDLVQGSLEGSNVNVVEELVGMIETQRAYEMNSKAIAVSDQMLQYLNNNL